MASTDSGDESRSSVPDSDRVLCSCDLRQRFAALRQKAAESCDVAKDGYQNMRKQSTEYFEKLKSGKMAEKAKGASDTVVGGAKAIARAGEEKSEKMVEKAKGASVTVAGGAK